MAKRKKDEDQENASNPNESENFGLPEIEYKPLERNETNPETEQDQPSASEPVHEPVADQPQYEYVPPVEDKSKAPVVISIVIGLVIILAGFFLYYYVYKPNAEKEKQEQIAEAARKKAEADRQAKLRAAEAERKRKEAEEAAKNAKPAEGTIETLSARTGRWYVVVTSAVDGDLIMDYAKKQSAKGKSSKIIPPYGKWKFHRLAIADYDTFANAQTNADAAKAEYGSGVWVIKY